MKLKKLNSHGFSHDIALIAFVAIFAISGVAYMVASNAETCNDVSGPVSGSNSVSGQVCDEVSGPVSGLAGSCVIEDVPPVPAAGQVLTPYVVVKNAGTQDFTPQIAIELKIYDQNAYATVTNGKDSDATIGPNATTNFNLHQYTAKYASSEAVSGYYQVNSTNPSFSCTAGFTLPNQPAAASSSAAAVPQPGTAQSSPTAKANTNPPAVVASPPKSTTSISRNPTAKTSTAPTTQQTSNSNPQPAVRKPVKPAQQQSIWQKVIRWLGF